MGSCFFHTLTELDPQYSSHLAARPRSYKATATQRLLRKVGVTGEESEDIRLVRCHIALYPLAPFSQWQVVLHSVTSPKEIKRRWYTSRNWRICTCQQ
jgi:hypothetical protein